jgi:hypothetical protein
MHGRTRKLTAHQQREARERIEAGETHRSVARSYNVSQATISRLTAGVERYRGDPSVGYDRTQFVRDPSAPNPVSRGRMGCGPLHTTQIKTPATRPISRTSAYAAFECRRRIKMSPLCNLK